MAIGSDAIRARASREATDWLILLQEESEDAALLRRFQDWRAASPENAEAWAETRRAAAAIEAGGPAEAGRWQPALERLRAGGETAAAACPSRRFAPPAPRRRALALGGLAAAAALALALFVPDVAVRLRSDLATGTAETRSLTLADGSLVTLAPESAIALPETGRTVVLLAGQAYFEVAPDPERPFRVEAEALEVTVLGTGFEVRREESASAVAVEHGAVSAALRTQPSVAEALGAGETARATAEGGLRRGSLPATQVAAWRHHQLIAQDQPLGALVERLRPYHAGAILVTDEALAGRPVTGVYDLSDPLAALRAIARAQDAEVLQVTPWLLLVSPS